MEIPPSFSSQAVMSGMEALIPQSRGDWSAKLTS